MISEGCLSTLEPNCKPSSCRWRCALEVIDELLGEQITGEEADDLLDLRWKLLNGGDAESTLRVFCAVRRRMERKHYLAFFRIRRWLENNVVTSIRLYPGAAEQRLTVKLDYYCMEAIRRASLCRGLRAGGALDRPRLRFLFRENRFADSGITLVATAAAAP